MDNRAIARQALIRQFSNYPKSTTRVIAGSGHCKEFLPRMAKNSPFAGLFASRSS